MPLPLPLPPPQMPNPGILLPPLTVQFSPINTRSAPSESPHTWSQILNEFDMNIQREFEIFASDCIVLELLLEIQTADIINVDI